MSFNKTELPRWANGTPPGDPYYAEPTEGQKDTGWVFEQPPPYQYQNWLHERTYEWIDHLDTYSEVMGSVWLTGGAVVWTGTTLTFSSDIQIKFVKDGTTYINRILAAASPLALADGDTLVAILDDTTTDETLTSVAYGSIVKGTYSVTAALTENTDEREVLVFRRTGNDLLNFINREGYITGSSTFLSAQMPIYWNYDFGLVSGKKFFYDANGDTYSYESSANVKTDVVGGIIGNQIDCATAGKTYIYHHASNTTGEIREFFRNSDNSVYFEQDYNFTSGDVAWLFQSNSKTHLIVSDTNSFFKPQYDFSIVAGKKFYFDATNGTGALTGDTHMQESSANVLDTTVGGVLITRQSSVFNPRTDVVLEATKKMRWDGNISGDTYTEEGSANVLDTYVGGTRMLRLEYGAGAELPDIDPPAANHLVRRSGIRGYSNFVVTSASAVTNNSDFNISSLSCSGYDVTLDWDRNFSSADASIPVGSGIGGSGQLTSLVFNTNSGSTVAYAYDSGGQVTGGWYGCVMVAGVQA